MWLICINIAVLVRTSFLLALTVRTPDKDELFYGDNKVGHYLIQIPDRRVCDISQSQVGLNLDSKAVFQAIETNPASNIWFGFMAYQLL